MSAVLLRAPPMARGNLAEQLASSLGREITSGALPPGHRLPTENALVQRFGVSRTVVREAVSRLRSDGLVVARQGAGVFVAGATEQRPFRIADVETRGDILAVVELRLAFEVEAAALAARRRTQRQLAAMRAALDGMAAAIRGGDAGVEDRGVEADVLFHKSLAAATGNRHFITFMSFLEPTIRRAIGTSRRRTSRRGAALSQRVQREHEAIYAAIAARDPAAARDAARRHIEGTARRLKARIDDDAPATDGPTAAGPGTTDGTVARARAAAR